MASRFKAVLARFSRSPRRASDPDHERRSLHPEPWQLAGMLILSPASAFSSAMGGSRVRSNGAWSQMDPMLGVRHPCISFLDMLIATGLAVSARGSLATPPSRLAVFSTELRISLEESELTSYEDYRKQTLELSALSTLRSR